MKANLVRKALKHIHARGMKLLANGARKAGGPEPARVMPAAPTVLEPSLEAAWGSLPGATVFVVHYRNQRGRLSTRRIRVLARGLDYILADCFEENAQRWMRRSRFISGGLEGDNLLDKEQLLDLFDEVRAHPVHGVVKIGSSCAFKTDLAPHSRHPRPALAFQLSRGAFSDAPQVATILACNSKWLHAWMPEAEDYAVVPACHIARAVTESGEHLHEGEDVVRYLHERHRGLPGDLDYFDALECLSSKAAAKAKAA
jgi:hypothetical protein